MRESRSYGSAGAEGGNKLRYPEIFLGDKFWTAPKMGRDSRSGVLVHEVSHLNGVGETFDYMRGENDCLVLAKSDPSEALYNADSFEYFIEI